MPSAKKIQDFARLIVKLGINVQKDQGVMINANTDTKYFVRILVEEAYKAGSKQVTVRWSDEVIQHHAYHYNSLETLEEIPNYLVEQFNYFIEKEYALISVHAETPGLMADVDSIKLQTAALASGKALKAWREHVMGNRTQWTVVSVPTPNWAKKLFPDLSEDEAVETLWTYMLEAVRVDGVVDPVELWDKHNAVLHAHNLILNQHQFKTLNFKNSLGTDLSVQLVENHVWAGGSETSTKGVVFNANIPTEEAFTMPHKDGANGFVYASKPLNYQGTTIDEFWLKFENGKVVDYDAKVGKDALTNLLTFDQGSSSLGEVALVGYDTPISKSGLLYINTLFDENASCHLALGRAYPMNVKQGNDMSLEALEKLGYNNSMAHVDFMFGTKDLSIVGKKANGETVVVFEDGNFVF
jgi:aminopeptidase